LYIIYARVSISINSYLGGKVVPDMKLPNNLILIDINDNAYF